jgi:DNA-binding transcriptional LysR family regulator
MRQLEERLGTRLLHRTTRSLSVTDAGRRLLDQLRPAMDQIAGALENLDQDRLHPTGRLRIYATSHLAATTVIVPIWDRFLSTYPEVDLELHVGDEPIDIVAKGFDAGSYQDRVAADMIAVRIMGLTGWQLSARQPTSLAGGARTSDVSPVIAAFNTVWRWMAVCSLCR